MSFIRFVNVSKQFPGTSRPAVDNCNLEIERGSFVVLLGLSGCGKTTLLKMVNRLHEPTSGQIIIDGNDTATVELTALRRRIGYVIQQTGLFPHMTVAQNIAIVPQLLGWERERTNTRIDELLTLIELSPAEYRDRYPAQLSGGQQQRVGLARALAGDPEVMLMDEPFGAIDAITRASLQDEMLRLQQQVQKTILFVTHDVEEALKLADKIVVMDIGKVAQYDTPFNILSRPANSFVRELVGADDTVRHLGLLSVEQAMVAPPPDYRMNGSPTIAADDNLRNALSLLLRSSSDKLVVTRDDAPIGLLSLGDIRQMAGQEPAV